MHGLTNIMRREARKALSERATTRMDIVSALRPVALRGQGPHPARGRRDGVPAHRQPLGGQWLGALLPRRRRATWSTCISQEAGKLAAYISLRFFGAVAQPLAVPSGEFWLVHRSGEPPQVSR